MRYHCVLLCNKVEKEKSQSWEANITCKLLLLKDALSLMEEGGQPPSIELFLSALLKCKQERSLDDAMCLLRYSQRCGLDTHDTLGNYIVPLFAEVGSLHNAQRVFNKLGTRNEHSWNSLIVGLVKYGDPCNALTIYKRMRENSLKPSGFTFVSLLRACADLKDLKSGQELHGAIAQIGLERALFVGSSLVDMYMNCGSSAKALEVFDKLSNKDAVCWNVLIAGFCKLGLFHEAVDSFGQMQRENVVPSNVTFVFLLKAFAGLEAINSGQEIHAEIITKGLSETEHDICNELIEMYGNCGFFSEAEDTCEKLVFRDTVSWTALLAGYCKHKLFKEALSCFKQMQMEGIAPGSVTFINILKACGNTEASYMGQQIHVDIVKKGLLENDLVNTALIDMYGNVGLVAEARKVFDNLHIQDQVSWTALIAGYSKCGCVQEAADCFFEMEQENVLPDLLLWNALIEGFAKNGRGEEVLSCLEQMLSKGIYPDTVTFLFGLKACCSIAAKSKGRELHLDITKKGLVEINPNIGNALVDFYATSGLLEEAEVVLHMLSVQDVVSWTSLMAGYTRHGLGHKALYLFDQMQSLYVLPSTVTFVCSLKACCLLSVIGKGQELHAEIEKRGLLALDVVGNALVDMYASCGLLLEAQKVFDKLPVKDMVVWTALITGYAKHDQSKEAVRCFQQMKSEGVIPDAVSWSTLITGYAMHNCGKDALHCLREMKHAGVCPDAVTFVSSLKACGSIRAIDVGQTIHAEIVQVGLLERDVVVGNALVDMYATCGLLLEAQDVFDKLLDRDTVSWTSLIAGYTKHGYGREALNCFDQMQLKGFSPDDITFICILKACGITGASSRGQEIHKAIARSGSLEKSVLVGNALLDMYVECGLLANAYEVFTTYLAQDCVSWTAMIAGYAKHGCIEEALECFKRQQAAGIAPDTLSWHALLTGYACAGDCENAFDALNRMRGGMDPNANTFTGIFTACSHAGLVDLGQSYFMAMSKDCSITPIIEHHVCMVDLLGRAGQLDNAVAFVNQMPYHPTLVMWHAMLGACQKWSASKIAKQAFEEAVQLDVNDAATYVCMSNIYAMLAYEKIARILQEDVREADNGK